MKNEHIYTYVYERRIQQKTKNQKNFCLRKKQHNNRKKTIQNAIINVAT